MNTQAFPRFNTEADRPTCVYCILGNPVAQSMSPLMHNAAFRYLRMNAVYVPFEIDDLPGALSGLKHLKIKGASVTHPFKEAVIDLLDTIDDVAEAIGAVNTLVISGNHIQGTNTDWLGVVHTIETLMPIQGHTFAVLGAGGTARAAVFGITQRGGEVVVINRSEAKGRSLAAEFEASFVPLRQLEAVRADCLLNTTPVGMHPHTDEMPVDRETLKRFGAVVDVIYNPFPTKLLKEAQALGCKTASGLEMFIYQGTEQFKRWRGIDPPGKLMKDVVYRQLSGDTSSFSKGMSAAEA